MLMVGLFRPVIDAFCFYALPVSHLVRGRIVSSNADMHVQVSVVESVRTIIRR